MCLPVLAQELKERHRAVMQGMLMDVLRALAASSTPLRFSDIAHATYLSLPSLSRLLKTLEARGLVRRAVHEDDLRAAQLSLSRSGKALIARIAPVSEAHYDEITTAIGAADLERLYALLDVVGRRLHVEDRTTGDD